MSSSLIPLIPLVRTATFSIFMGIHNRELQRSLTFIVQIGDCGMLVVEHW